MPGCGTEIKKFCWIWNKKFSVGEPLLTEDYTGKEKPPGYAGGYYFFPMTICFLFVATKSLFFANIINAVKSQVFLVLIPQEDP